MYDYQHNVDIRELIKTDAYMTTRIQVIKREVKQMRIGLYEWSTTYPKYKQICWLLQLLISCTLAVSSGIDNTNVLQWTSDSSLLFLFEFNIM